MVDSVIVPSVIRLYRERDNGKIGGAHLKVKVMHLYLRGLIFRLVSKEL